MAIVKHRFTIEYESSVNTETGEILETTIVGRTESKKKPVKKESNDSDTEAKVYLEDNKLRLNSLAIELMGVNPGDRIDIQYATRPIIGISGTFGTPDSGCKLTKSGTVSFRGKKAETLAAHGTEFKLIPNDHNQFILDNGKEVPEEPELKGDENVQLCDESDLDFNIESLLDDTTEVKASIFQL